MERGRMYDLPRPLGHGLPELETQRWTNLCHASLVGPKGLLIRRTLGTLYYHSVYLMRRLPGSPLPCRPQQMKELAIQRQSYVSLRSCLEQKMGDIPLQTEEDTREPVNDISASLEAYPQEEEGDFCT